MKRRDLIKRLEAGGWSEVMKRVYPVFFTMVESDVLIEVPDSNINDLNISNATFVEEGTTIISLVDADPTLYRRKIDTRTVRRNVTLPGWLNYEAEAAGINVSRVLQEALMKVLNVSRR